MTSDVEEKVVGQGGKGDHILCGSFVEVEGVIGGHPEIERELYSLATSLNKARRREQNKRRCG